MKNQSLKVSLSLSLVEIMNVVESLPEGHSLLPYLTQKRDTLIAAHRIQVKTLSIRKEN